MIDDISTRAKVRGVTIGKIEPLPVEPGPPFDTYRYRLEIMGHYDQLGEYLSDIASLPRIVVPQDVVLKAASQGAQRLLNDTLGTLLQANLAVRTFVKSPPPPPRPPARPGTKPGAGQ
jgi:type IV pilus assembly protein PilO